ncbi:hypothetical protein OFB47_29710, partial [Escherichia coli]|nr:hypothetical protein [Escherichia coli]
LLNAEFVNREIGLPIRDQLWVIGKYALAGFTAATAGYLAGFFFHNIYIHFIVASVPFSAIYLAICYKFKLRGMLEVTDHLRMLRNA